jgi:Ca2+-binding EF-hand superfamily protein
MRSQGFSLAYKIYETLNKLNTTYLNWEDFLQGMLSMKSHFIQDKIDLFFHIIDTDGNGFLSFDEVYEISKGSLQRTLGDKDDNNDNDEVVSTLASFFANLIFQLVDMPIDQEISIEKIREKILEGQEAAGYLEMFICSDSFTNF